MDFRMATIDDLQSLKNMYEKIVVHMNQNNIQIWDEVYPSEFLKEDIENKRLYVLMKENDIAAAFALCETNDGEGYLKWKNNGKKAFYLDRFGVNVNALRQGTGRIMLNHAMNIAKSKGGKFLRLFVVDINKPAINLYLKHGFTQVEGVYEEKIDDFVLREYGFELELLDLIS